jgi:hypothetical protein
MKMQLDLISLIKTKEMICYCKSFGYGGQNALNTISNDLTHVSELIEKDHNGYQPSPMPLGDQHSRAHSCP